MTTKEQANKCTTHHNACDCREHERQQMEQALRKISEYTMLGDSMDDIKAICDEVLGDE